MHIPVVAIVHLLPTVHGVQSRNSVLTLSVIAVRNCVIKTNVMAVFAALGLGMLTVIRLLHVPLENPTVLTIQEEVAVDVLHSRTVPTVLPLAIVLMVFAIQGQNCATTMIHVPPLLVVVATVSNVHGLDTLTATVVLFPN